MKVLVEYDTYYLERDRNDLEESKKDVEEVIGSLRGVVDPILIKKIAGLVTEVNTIFAYLDLILDADEFCEEEGLKA